MPSRISSSAIWTALVAAPLRRLSATTNIARPFGCDSIAPHAPDVDLVTPLAPERRRHVFDDQARRLREQLERALDGQVLARLDVDRLGVPDPHRHAHARDRHGDRLVLEDLARLEHHLALFVGVVVAARKLPAAPITLNAIWSADRCSARASARRRASARLGLELLDRLAARARHRLIGGDDQPLDPDLAMDRRERDHQLHRRAVRIGDQSVGGPSRARAG